MSLSHQCCRRAGHVGKRCSRPKLLSRTRRASARGRAGLQPGPARPPINCTAHAWIWAGLHTVGPASHRSKFTPKHGNTRCNTSTPACLAETLDHPSELFGQPTCCSQHGVRGCLHAGSAEGPAEAQGCAGSEPLAGPAAEEPPSEVRQLSFCDSSRVATGRVICVTQASKRNLALERS
jgi:hypothetical protein